MTGAHAALAAALLLASTSQAQESQPVYQTQPSNNVRFRVDALLRQEWTEDIFVTPTEFTDQNRRRLRLLPRLELGGERFGVGVGGDFNYSSDENVEPRPPVIRDNYDSRDARVDLAFARLEPLSWLHLEGGRFVMPVALTEMLWDRDLRPQGAALTLQHRDDAGVTRVSATALGARGSHVFDDDTVDMWLFSGQATFPGGGEMSLQFVGSYLTFRHIDGLESGIRRQNTRVNGDFVYDYRMVDLVGRFRQGGNAPLEVVADYCWNTAVDDDNRGLWLAAALGAVQTSPVRAEYTFAQVDKDATLAAYATDDFFWSSGWKGHRLDLGTRITEKSSVHVVGQLQRFKDSPRVEEQDHWVKRLRLELRVSY